MADASIDAAFLAAVFGEIPDRPRALEELRRVLKPGARLSFLETMRASDYVYTDTLKDLCRVYGFQLIEASAPVPGLYHDLRRSILLSHARNVRTRLTAVLHTIGEW